MARIASEISPRIRPKKLPWTCLENPPEEIKIGDALKIPARNTS